MKTLQLVIFVVTFISWIDAQDVEANCWNACDKKAGYCDACGPGRACCKLGYNSDPVECQDATSACVGNHCCTDVIPTDCTVECGGHGNCPDHCGEGRACCQKGLFGQSKVCDNAIYPVDLFDQAYCTPIDPPPCWHSCGEKGGYCPGSCGYGKACCRKDYAGDGIDCEGATAPCDGYHCCTPIKALNCWYKCGGYAGNCDDYCGIGRACCRKDFSSDPSECKNAVAPCVGQHCCSPVEPPNCWNSCGKAGSCPGFCGAGRSCCQKNFASDPAECNDALPACVGYHCCAAPCGQSINDGRKRVVHGDEARPGEWPWIVNIGSCAGTLITPNWVLTASHCVVGIEPDEVSTRTVKLGAHDVSQKETSVQKIAMKRVITHPDYADNGHLRNDIALIELATAAQLDDRVGLVCLPEKGVWPAVGTQCFIAGWGGDHTRLQQTSLPVLRRGSSICPVDNKAVCVGMGFTAPDDHPNACYGDSGGPLVCPKADGRWQLDGVISYVKNGCKYVTGNAPVNEYIDWINVYIQ